MCSSTRLSKDTSVVAEETFSVGVGEYLDMALPGGGMVVVILKGGSE